MKTLKTTSLLLAVVISGAGALYAWGALADAKPALAPLGPPPAPADNPQTPAKVELGKLLFFDPRLGGDATVSCASCHEPSAGWAFPDGLSMGYPGTVHWRNSQTIVNTAYYGKLFWAGKAKSLEAQAGGAAKSAVGGNGESDVMEARLAFIPEYRKRFKAVFGGEYPRIKHAWRAIAAFERSLVQTDTPADKYLKGDKSALSKKQLRGMKLFTGKANCIQCHNGPLASNERYYNLGVPPSPRWNDDGLAQITFRYEQFAKGSTQAMYRKIKDDAGLYYSTKQKSDMGKFRVPSLRYTKYTAPYMHNGTLATLKDVVEFYNAGGGKNDFTDGTMGKNKTKQLKPLGLNKKQIDDLVAFIEAFSGPEIEMEEPKLPDYAPLPDVAKAD